MIPVDLNVIRRLQRSDYHQVFELLQQFARETGIRDLNKENYDYDQVHQVLLRCEKGGVSFVAQVDDRITGCILSIPVPDLWIKEIVRLRELAWFVELGYRGSSQGARLYDAYVREAEQLRRQHRITGYTISKLANSPDFDYERRGFRHIESTYMMGA